MAGLLDFLKTPEGQGLLSAGFGAAAGARPGQPWNTLGRGGLAGLAGYSNAQDQLTQQAENETQRKYREMQMKTLESQMAKQVAQEKWSAGLSDVMAPKPQEIDQFTGTTQMQAPSQEVVQKYLMDANSPFRDKLIEQKLFPKGPEYKVVGDALVGIGPDGKVAPAYTAPPKPEAAPSSVREYQFAQGQGYQGSYEQFQRDMKRAGATNVSVNTKQETEEAKTVGKFFGEDYAKVQQSGASAQSSINRLGRLEQLLDGVDTGKFSPLGLEVAKAAKAAGINIDDNLSNKEAAVALSSEIALQLRNPAGGAGMPGAMSDADRTFLAGMVPGIEKTPEGRKLIIETGKKLAQREIEVARMAREYRKRNGSINEGFYDELAANAEQKPLFKSSPKSAAGPVAPFADAAKEQRYQEWLRSQRK